MRAGIFATPCWRGTVLGHRQLLLQAVEVDEIGVCYRELGIDLDGFAQRLSPRRPSGAGDVHQPEIDVGTGIVGQ